MIDKWDETVAEFDLRLNTGFQDSHFAANSNLHNSGLKLATNRSFPVESLHRMYAGLKGYASAYFVFNAFKFQEK